MNDTTKPKTEIAKAPVPAHLQNHVAGPDNPIWKFGAGPVKLDAANKMKAIEGYINTGSLVGAARAAGVSTETIKNHMKKDPVFKEQMTEAYEYFRHLLETECFRRGVKGWLEPIYNTKTGQLLGHKECYDSALLQKMMNRHMPEYNTKSEVDVRVGGGVLVVGASPQTAEEWMRNNPNNLQQALDATTIITEETADVIENISPSSEE